MAYKIRLYQEYLNSNSGSISIADGAVAYDKLDIPLTGISVGDYPESIAEALTWQLENFANQLAPVNALQGQTWFNTQTKTLMINTAINGSAPNWEEAGKTSTTGPTGPTGAKGDDGDSAYQVWLDEGYTGSEQDYLNSLKGTDGINGVNGQPGNKGDKGDKGDAGADGTDGANGIQGVQGTAGPAGPVNAAGGRVRWISQVREITCTDGWSITPNSSSQWWELTLPLGESIDDYVVTVSTHTATIGSHQDGRIYTYTTSGTPIMTQAFQFIALKIT